MVHESSVRHPSRHLSVRLSSRRALRWQLGIIAFLLVASTLGQLLFRLIGDVPILDGVLFLFYVDGEGTVPATWSALVILACAAMFAWIAWLECGMTRQGRHQGRYWALMAAVLSYIAIDEFFALHERTMEPLREMLGITSGPLFFAWVVPALLILATLGLVLLGWLRHLPPATRRGFLVAGAVFVTGALGFEMLSAMYVTVSGSEDVSRHHSLSLLPFTTAEEGLEMIGMALLLVATIRHVETFHPAASLDLGVAPTVHR